MVSIGWSTWSWIISFSRPFCDRPLRITRISCFRMSQFFAHDSILQWFVDPPKLFMGSKLASYRRTPNFSGVLSNQGFYRPDRYIYIYNIIIYYISKYQVPWRYWSANVVRTAQTCWHELKMGSSQEWFWWRFMCQLLRTCSGYSHQNAVTPIVLGVVLIELLDDSWFHPIIPSDSDDIRCWSYMLYPSHPITRNRHMFETERPKSPKRIFLALLTLPVRFWYSHVKYCHMCKWFTYKRWYNIMIFHGKLW